MATPAVHNSQAVDASVKGASAPMTHRQIMEAHGGAPCSLLHSDPEQHDCCQRAANHHVRAQGHANRLRLGHHAALLANAATTPIWGGKLADLFDKKLLVQLSIIIFVAGSVMAGLSETIPLLLTARVIQGVAMGGLTALAQAIIGSMIPPRDRGKYSGYMGAVMAVGTAGGPLLGGFIVDSPLGWRWTFFVCVPLAVVALILLQVTLKIQHIKRPAKIDWLGSVLLTSGVSLLLIWVSFAGNPDYYDWFSWQSALMVGGGVACWHFWCWWKPKSLSPSFRSRSSPSAPRPWPSLPPLRSVSPCSVRPPSWVSTSRLPGGAPHPPRPACSRCR